MLREFRSLFKVLILFASPVFFFSCLGTDGNVSQNCVLDNPVHVGQNGAFNLSTFKHLTWSSIQLSDASALSFDGENSVDLNFLSIHLYKKHPTLKHIGFRLAYNPEFTPPLLTEEANHHSKFFIDQAVTAEAGQQLWIKEYNKDFNDLASDIYPKVLILTEVGSRLTAVEMILSFREENEQRLCLRSFDLK